MMLEMIMLSMLRKSSNLDRVASISCLEKVVRKIEHMHDKMCKNVYAWSDGTGSQFRSLFIFKLLTSKGAIDGTGGTVKNVILRKVKSGQLVVHFPLEFSEAVTKFNLSIYSVYLPENKNITKSEDKAWLERSIKHWKCMS